MGKTRQKKRLPFSGADGEGGDIDSRHEYLLLRVGEFALETGKPLTTWECLAFLSELPLGREYVSYFFDYDVTMILRGLSENRISRLLDREGRTPETGLPYPVDVGDFQIDYLPRKEFRVRRKGGDWRVINDVGTFYQSAFLAALDKWSIGSEELRESIGRGKGKRAEFGAMTQETRDYNGLEIELLEDLMESFRRVCEEVGYVPRKWQGPGNVAAAMFAKHGIAKSEDLHLPGGLLGFAQSAYYGGRFETTAVGPVKGPIWQYDINSAYPYACTQLPCLVHGRWKKTTAPSEGSLYVARLSFSAPINRSLYPFPVRRKGGSIHYPRTGTGWYWAPEISAARRHGAKVTVYEAWEYETRCDCQPFGFVEKVYTERLRLGKAAKGMVLKLALNSLYGKLAQSIGSAPYANPVWAGLITSITRAALYSAVGDRDDCFMLATDGLFMGGELGVCVGDSLGAWDLKIHSQGMFIIQPGLYFAGDDKPKTRGVPMGKVFERRGDFERAWSDSEWSTIDRTVWKPDGGGGEGIAIPEVQIPLRNFIGLRLAFARGKLATAGQWVETIKAISFDWRTKRKPYKVTRDEYGMRTWPYDGPDKTTPYSRTIGGNLQRDADRLTTADLPDWSEERLTPLE